MLRRVAIVFTAVSLVVAGTEGRQSPAVRPAGGTEWQLPIGTAAITGTVTAASDGRPLSSVVVTVRSAAENAPFTRTTVSDDAGRFEIAHLPAGRYVVSAIRVQYLQTNYGASLPNRAGMEILLAEGQQLPIAIPLVRGGIISGSVYRSDGLPLVNAQVRALRYAYVEGAKRLQPVTYGSFGATDDRGMYRMYNLLPGEYVLAVTPALNGNLAQIERAALEGQAIEAALAAARRGGPRTPLPSILPVMLPTVQGASTSPAGDPRDQAQLRAFAPAYFPNSATAGGATIIGLGAGEERTGADIFVTPVHASHVNGTVIGKPPGHAVQIWLRNDDPAEELSSPNARTGAEGQFTLTNVSPGRYTVLAETLPGSSERLWGRSALIVDHDSATPLTIALQPGRSFSGTVAWTGARGGRANGTPMTVSLIPLEGRQSPAFSRPTPAPVEADGRFTLAGVAPGRYLLRAGPGILESATINGEDALDLPIEVGRDDITNALVTLGDRQTQLSGTLTELAGKPSSSYMIVAAAVDRPYWTPGSRRIAVAPPAADGRFVFHNLPPGTYFLAAIGDLEPGSLFDPELLETLAAAAVSVTIAPGGRTVQDLRVAR